MGVLLCSVQGPLSDTTFLQAPNTTEASPQVLLVTYTVVHGGLSCGSSCWPLLLPSSLAQPPSPSPSLPSPQLQVHPTPTTSSASWLVFLPSPWAPLLLSLSFYISLHLAVDNVDGKGIRDLGANHGCHILTLLPFEYEISHQQGGNHIHLSLGLLWRSAQIIFMKIYVN